VKFSLPVEPWVYPLWAVAAAMLTLVIARRNVGLRWTATTIAVGYVGWRCVLWPILAGVGFPTLIFFAGWSALAGLRARRSLTLF
jgi:hypothetical protein